MKGQKMKMIPVKSSNAKEVGYRETDKELFVKFQNDSVYKYLDVPETIYKILMGAESFGKALNQFVKNHYDYVKIS